MIVYSWSDALSITEAMWRIDARTRSGGETVGGREQVVSSGLGRWVASVTVPLHDRASILAHAVLLDKLDGRANAVAVPLCQAHGSRVLPLVNGVPYSGAGLHLRRGQRPEDLGVAPTVAAIAAAGATSVTLNLGTLVGLEPGVVIGFGNRFHRITDTLGPAAYAIWPKLREIVPAGTAVEWKAPRNLMRLRADDSGSASLSLGRYGVATFDFVEAGW